MNGNTAEVCSPRRKNIGRSYPKAVEKINQLYNDGHQIWIFTSRGSKTGLDWRMFTEKQLSEWGIKYHKLIMGKPSFDVLVDDRAVSSLEELKY